MCTTSGMKSEEDLEYRAIKAPMTDMEFRNYLDSDGHMVKPGEFRLSIYQGGTEPSLRRVVWRHLLNIYPESMSGRERFAYMKRKENEYFELRDQWRKLQSSNQLSEEVKHVLSLVKKDVLRTDRTHKYYAGGDESKNLIALYNLLVTYALTHPEVSYCQGMSDIASPILVVQKEEAQAYLCFCGLMKRLRTNFLYDGEAITTKLQHLSALVNFYDPIFHVYMKDHGADDLFFCYRWLLLEMKREFPFDDALYMLEVMWSTLPPSPPETELALKDDSYCQTLLVSVSPNSPSFASKTQYSRLLAKRRLSNVVKDSPMAKSPVSKSPKSVLSLKQNAISENEENVRSNTLDASDHNLAGKLEEHEGPSKSENQPEGITKNKESHSENCNELNEEQEVAVINNCETHSENSEELKEQACNGNEKVVETVDEHDLNQTNSSSNESSSDYNSAVVSLATTSPSTSVLTNSSSYLSSSSLSADRFPSLISGSVDDNMEVLSLKGGRTLTDICNDVSCREFNNSNSNINNFDSKENSIDKVLIANGLPASQSLKGYEDENENQAQFYISLEEKELPKPMPHMSKKSEVPQIKGSFFSGMKRLLMSPERKPGKAQQVKTKSNDTVQGVPKSSSLGNIASSNKTEGKNSSTDSNDNDSEHTLFEVNRMIRSMNINTTTAATDSDSGNGSLTSSLNLAQPAGKLQSNSRTSGRGASKSVDILTEEHKKYFDQKYKDMINDVPAMEGLLGGKQPSFCDNHFAEDGFGTPCLEGFGEKEERISDCVEAVDPEELKADRFKQLPSPEEFGYGNPFLMFTCLTVLLQHRDIIMKTGMEYDELAMYFDKMVRKHNVNKVLHQARVLYTEYIRMQQKIQTESYQDDDVQFSV